MKSVTKTPTAEKPTPALVVPTFAPNRSIWVAPEARSMRATIPPPMQPTLMSPPNARTP